MQVTHFTDLQYVSLQGISFAPKKYHIFQADIFAERISLGLTVPVDSFSLFVCLDIV